MHTSTLFINGEWVSETNQQESVSINPATLETVGTLSMASEEQLNAAVDAADVAFKEWRRLPVPTRAQYIKKIVNILQSKKNELAKIMTEEMGKVLTESLGEVGVVIEHGEYMQAEGRRLFGETVPSATSNRTIQMVREPLGVVACITPWNFPVSLAAYKIFSALITGNTIVWKPASEVALSAKFLAEVIEESGLPKGVFNFVTGSGNKIGSALASHKKVSIVAFTGSTEVGQAIMKMCVNDLKRVSLELGGKNAVIVLQDADIESAANGIIQSAFATSGQRCTAASRVIVEKECKNELLIKLKEKVLELKLGNGLDEDSKVGPLVSQKQLDTVSSYVNKAIEDGGVLVVGGDRNKDFEGYFYEPTIISEVKREHVIAREEVFGPVLAVIEVDSYEEAMEVNNDTIYGLSTSIYTKSLELANRASKEAVSGLVYINSGTSSAEMGVAFGGMKMSGNGHREVSHHAFDVMTEWKSIYTTY